MQATQSSNASGVENSSPHFGRVRPTNGPMREDFEGRADRPAVAYEMGVLTEPGSRMMWGLADSRGGG